MKEQVLYSAYPMRPLAADQYGIVINFLENGGAGKIRDRLPYLFQDKQEQNSLIRLARLKAIVDKAGISQFVAARNFSSLLGPSTEDYCRFMGAVAEEIALSFAEKNKASTQQLISNKQLIEAIAGLPGETQEYGSLAVEEATFNFTCGHGYNIHSYCCPDAVVIDHLDYPCASLLYEIKSSQKAADTDQIRRIKKPFGDKCARKIIGRGLKEAAGISEEVTLPPYRDLPVVLLAVQENQSGNCRRSGQNSPAFDREKVIGLDITGLTIIMLEILTGGIETPQRWEYLFVPTKPKVGGTLTRLRAKRGSLRFA